METDINKPLTQEESDAWKALVEEGAVIRAPKKEEREQRQRANIEAHGKSVIRKWTTGKYSGKISESVKTVPPCVIRWLIARGNGLPVREANAVSGTTIAVVHQCQQRNESVRCAMDAMHVRSKAFIGESAISAMEDAMSGRAEENKVAVKAAQWYLERAGDEDFRDPRLRVGTAESNGGKAVGGIVINLIDVNKPYSPPKAIDVGVGAESLVLNVTPKQLEAAK